MEERARARGSVRGTERERGTEHIHSLAIDRLCGRLPFLFAPPPSIVHPLCSTPEPPNNSGHSGTPYLSPVVSYSTIVFSFPVPS